MRIKVTLVLLFVALMTGIMVSNYVQPASAETVELKAIGCWPADHKMHKWYFKFIKEVNERLKGELSIKWIGGPEIVGAFSQFDALRSGVADMTNCSSGYFSGECIAGNSLNAVRPEPEHQRKVFRESGVMEVINEAYRKKSGVLAIANFGTGRGFTVMSTKPVVNGSLSGLKIRTSGVQFANGVKILGGVPSITAA
jgi:TRAP-type C4-dicarboxylate transport system substrate-binding protein